MCDEETATFRALRRETAGKARRAVGFSRGSNASLIGGTRSCSRGRTEGDDNAKSQRRREEEERGPVVACRGMGTLPMTLDGRPARPASRGVLRQAGATSKLAGFSPEHDPFAPIVQGLQDAAQNL